MRKLSVQKLVCVRRRVPEIEALSESRLLGVLTHYVRLECDVEGHKSCKKFKIEEFFPVAFEKIEEFGIECAVFDDLAQSAAHLS